MNIINKFLLKIVYLPLPFYKKMGVDVPRLKAIVETKLLLDDRRPNSFQQRKRKKEKPVSLATVGTMVMSAFIGAIYLLCFYLGNDMVTHLTFYFSMFFFMLSLTLISDFTSVLIDVRDNYIILPKPVNDRTFVVARLLHILLHILKIVLPMSIAGLIYMFNTNTILGTLVFLLMIALVTLFALFFINAVYIIILRVTTPQRFKAIISYIQIFFAIAMYASYQILPRMMSRLSNSANEIVTSQKIIFYPLYWFAIAWRTLTQPSEAGLKSIGLTCLALLLPFICIYIVIKYLAPYFNNKLALINSGNNETFLNKKPIEKKKSYSSSIFLSRVFTKNLAEKMGFQFTWKMTSRSRDFKMKVYPSIGYLAVYAVIIFMDNKHLTFQQLAKQDGGGRIIIISAIYFTSFLLSTALNQYVYSEQYKSSWIYFVMPMKNPGDIISGATKAVILKFYIPLVAFVIILGILIIGPSILPNAILGLSNVLLISSLIVFIGYKYFPFSRPLSMNIRTGGMLRSLGILFISFLMAGIQYLIYRVTGAIIIFAILSLIATWLVMDAIGRCTWEQVRNTYE